MKYKSIIFDQDDTLLRSFEALTDAYIEVGNLYDMKISVDDIKTHWGKPAEEVILEVFKYSDTLENLQDKLSDHLPNGMIPAFDGAIELIEQLSQSYTLGIVTASIARYTPSNLLKAGFDIDKFDFIHKVEDTTHHKPDPRVFDEALELLNQKMNIEKEEILFVGDSLHDYKAAHGANIDYLIVNTGPTTYETLIKNQVDPNRIINNLTDLTKFLNE
jgi:phosphoglycolate phosphatase